MSDVRDQWRNELAATPDCIAIERLGDARTPAELEHLQSCVRCQTEAALFAEFQSDATAEESGDAQWIAAELQRRLQTPSNVKQFRPRRQFAALAAAAATVIVIGTGYWMENREPAIDSGLATETVYRSGRLDAIAPLGEIENAPNELQWSAVPNASTYSVRILEIDRTLLWSAETPQSRVAIPATVMARFAPGKNVMWEVDARRGSEVLASSGTQTFRVSVQQPRRSR